MSTGAKITYLTCAIAAGISMPSSARCQAPAWSGSTPPAVAPGTPTGSYALSDFETIDLYSGKVNFTIPIHDIGGRGAAGYRMVLPVQRGWTLSAFPDSGSTIYVLQTQATPDAIFGSLTDVPLQPYTPGSMYARAFNDNTFWTTCGATPEPPKQTLTKLVFIGPEGTETEFVDQQTGGQPLGTSCTSGQSRGTIFVAVDGSAKTFIASSAITDKIYPPSSDYGVSGTLLFPNGVRYIINDSAVTDIYDAEGNRTQVTSTYFTVSDPLLRSTSVTPANTGSNPVQDVIQYYGADGTQ